MTMGRAVTTPTPSPNRLARVLASPRFTTWFVRIIIVVVLIVALVIGCITGNHILSKRAESRSVVAIDPNRMTPDQLQEAYIKALFVNEGLGKKWIQDFNNTSRRVSEYAGGAEYNAKVADWAAQVAKQMAEGAGTNADAARVELENNRNRLQLLHRRTALPMPPGPNMPATAAPAVSGPNAPPAATHSPLGVSPATAPPTPSPAPSGPGSGAATPRSLPPIDPNALAALRAMLTAPPLGPNNAPDPNVPSGTVQRPGYLPPLPGGPNATN